MRLVNSCVSTAAKNTPYTVGGKIILSAARNHNKKLDLNILISLHPVDIMQEIIVYLCLGSVHIQSCQTREVFGWDGRCIRFCNHAVCVCWIANDQHLQHSSSQQGQSKFENTINLCSSFQRHCLSQIVHGHFVFWLQP